MASTTSTTTSANLLGSLSSLSATELDALLKQAHAIAEGGKAAALAAYTESLTDFVAQAIAKETPDVSKPTAKSAWVGYKVYGVPVVVDGHAFTVSVTITDTAKRDELAKQREIERARELLKSADTDES